MDEAAYQVEKRDFYQKLFSGKATPRKKKFPGPTDDFTGETEPPSSDFITWPGSLRVLGLTRSVVLHLLMSAAAMKKGQV